MCEPFVIFDREMTGSRMPKNNKAHTPNRENIQCLDKDLWHAEHQRLGN